MTGLLTGRVTSSRESKGDGITVLFHESNQGKGAAIRTAIPQITGDVVIVQDADLEYHPSEYPRLLAPIVDGVGRRGLWLPISGGNASGPFSSGMPLGNRIITTLSNMSHRSQSLGYGDWI